MDPRGWRPRGDPGRAIRGPKADLGDTEKALSPAPGQGHSDLLDTSVHLPHLPHPSHPEITVHTAGSLSSPSRKRNLQQPRAFGSGPAPYPCRHSGLWRPGLRVCHPQPGLTACKRLRHNLHPRQEGPQVTWFSASQTWLSGPESLVWPASTSFLEGAGPLACP